jgi:hypothetical protein
MRSPFASLFGIPGWTAGKLLNASPLKVLIVGQSEDFYTISTVQNVLAPEPLVAENQVTFWWHDRQNAGLAGVQSVTLTDAAVAGDPRVTAGMVAMANTFIRTTSRHIHLVMMVVSGTEPREVMDDAFVPGGPKRDWEHDWALHQAATADGIPIHYGWHSWFAGPGSYVDDYGKAFAAYLWGRDLNGDLLTYSEAAPLSLAIADKTWQVSRTLRDMFGGDGPKWIAMGGSHRFIDTDEVNDLENATTYVGGATQTSFSQKERATESWRALVRSPAFAGRVVDVGMHLNAHAIGKSDGAGGWTDGTHPSGETDDGINLRARYTALAILRGAGIETFALPIIDNAEWQPDGSYMEFWSNAGPITTLRLARSEPALPATYPHWTNVAGVQIDGVPAQNAQIVNGRVRVYPNSGSFTNTTLITFGEGGASGSLVYPDDPLNEFYKNWPIVDVGLLDVPGLPLSHLPDPAVLASTVEGAPQFTVEPAGPYFMDPAGNLPANAAAFTGTVTFAMDPAQTDNSAYLIGISGLQVQIWANNSNQDVLLSVRDNTGSFLVQSVSGGQNQFILGVMTTLTVSVDLVAGYARVWTDGDPTPIIDASFTSTDPIFQGVREVQMLANGSNGANQFEGVIERVAVWFEATPNGTLPVSAPYAEIAGDDATVAQHLWKLPAA